MFVGSTVGGYAGWYLGMPIGLWTAFLVSSAGTIGGLYAGYRVARYIERGW